MQLSCKVKALKAGMLFFQNGSFFVFSFRFDFIRIQTNHMDLLFILIGLHFHSIRSEVVGLYFLEQ